MTRSRHHPSTTVYLCKVPSVSCCGLPVVNPNTFPQFIFWITLHHSYAVTQGAQVKLPRKCREGKVLGRAAGRKGGDTSDDDDQERSGVFGEGLVLRAADAAESHGFRALFSAEEDGELSAAGPFAGQVQYEAMAILDYSRISCAAVSTLSGRLDCYCRACR